MNLSSNFKKFAACGLLTAAAALGAPNTLRAALVGHWDFEDGMATDLTGNGANGTLAGTAAIVVDPDPERGMVYSGDGNNSKIDLGNPASLNVVGQMSVAAWVKPNVLPQGQGNAGILQRGHQTGGGLPQREFVLRTGVNTATTSSYQFGTWSPNMHATFVAPAEDVNTWVHLAGTMTDVGGGLFTYRLYRNGTEVAVVENGPGMLPDYSVGWAIGARGGVTGQEREWNGFIDDVRIYNHPLSVEEVLMAMFGGPPPVPGDTDGDGIGGEFPDDFEPIRANFRKSVSGRSMGDLVTSGVVDFADFHQWKTAFVGGGGSLAGLDLSFGNVPEPSAAALALLALLGVCKVRKRR
ncbi:MAG TPA: LamG domain-containing protein [Lacipirellulaceae bacterium]|nr:LamG domain-containing protein [Lacipirellulaceae bacterium]